MEYCTVRNHGQRVAGWKVRLFRKDDLATLLKRVSTVVGTEVGELRTEDDQVITDPSLVEHVRLGTERLSTQM